MKKNVLFIAYYFPPIGGSGVQRSIKHVKYLPMYGYEPVVVTVKNGHNFAYDFGMLKEIPEGVSVYRSNSGEKLWLRNIIENVNKVISKFRNSNSSENNSVSEETNTVSKESLKDRIFRYLEYNYYVPDTKVRWYKHAVKDIKNRVLKEKDVDIIYSTSAPYTDHLIGLEIKKETNLPWIADFRDPWVDNRFIFDRYTEKRKAKERMMEREIVEKADIIIQVTEEIAQQYRERYPEYADKFVVITNGFDEEDAKGIKEENEKFTIRYTGILTEGFSIESLVKALESICNENNEFKENFKLEFTGFVSEDNREILVESQIKDKIIFNEYVPHNKAVELMKNANINLIILPDEENSKGIYTGKIFDYMLSEKPILAIMPTDGVAAVTITDNKIGKAYNHGDVDGIKKFILTIYDMFINKEDISTDAINKCEKFSRKNLAKQLAGYMDEILNKNK